MRLENFCKVLGVYCSIDISRAVEDKGRREQSETTTAAETTQLPRQRLKKQQGPRVYG